jgi:hypothetical protein
MLYAYSSYAATTLSDTIWPDVSVSIRLRTQPCFLDSCSMRVATSEQDGKKKKSECSFRQSTNYYFTVISVAYLSMYCMYSISVCIAISPASNQCKGHVRVRLFLAFLPPFFPQQSSTQLHSFTRTINSQNLTIASSSMLSTATAADS